MSGFVYFLGPDDWRVGKVKIGYTVGHPNGRLAGLQTGCPYKLAVYGFTPGDFSLERALHETFASLRQHGEWFDMDGKLLALVSCLYFDKYGRLPHSEREFCAHVSATVCADEPPHPTFCSIDRWMDSAEPDAIDVWLHDRAWAAYKAGQDG